MKYLVCKGDGKSFGLNHQHYAKGYCFSEYRKMRYRQQQAKKILIPPIPRFCNGDGLLFNKDNHKHYAKGYCQYTYFRMKRGMYPGAWYCPKCPKYFPDDPPQKVLRENALCEKCIPIVQKILDNNK